MSAIPLRKVIAYVRRLTDADTCGLTDRDLLASFGREQDEAAFAELVRRHGPMVLAACRRVLHHEQDAEDAFQAAFLVLARKASSIRQHDSVGGWLYQVAYRLAVRARTLGARRSARFMPLGYEPAAPGSPPSVAEALDAELALLPDHYRTAIVLCYLEGKTQSEAAELLSTSTAAINGWLKRARELLRHRLARHGTILSAAGVAEILTSSAAEAALSAAIVAQTARIAVLFITESGPAAGASALAATLAKGALHTMIPAKFKIMSAFAIVVAMLTSAALMVPLSAQEEPVGQERDRPTPLASDDVPAPKGDKAKMPRQCIILWMNGGPSQIDTFDPKAGNIALFKAIDTNVKGVQFSETLPLLAKQANHLAVLRGVHHRDGDHGRGGHWMRTGMAPGGVDYPDVASVLAKELGDGSAKLPRLVTFDRSPIETVGFGPGFLGVKYAPLLVGKFPPRGDWPTLPELEAFEAIDKDNAPAMRKTMAKAFNVEAENAEVRGAYGKSRFGRNCLLARRLIEVGVPVVEISMAGWDAHANADVANRKLAGELDAGMATLIKDLHERKRLERTLIVWMGEFGRTPRINQNTGRDHWPMGFSVVLAGAGIKGGQTIGKTSADATKIDEGDVTPPELLATIYHALGVDPAKKNREPGGKDIPLVEKGNNPVKAALR